MRKILYLLAIIAVAGCQKNEPDLLMGKNASERMQQNKENLKKNALGGALWLEIELFS